MKNSRYQRRPLPLCPPGLRDISHDRALAFQSKLLFCRRVLRHIKLFQRPLREVLVFLHNCCHKSQIHNLSIKMRYPLASRSLLHEVQVILNPLFMTPLSLPLLWRVGPCCMWRCCAKQFSSEGRVRWWWGSGSTLMLEIGLWLMLRSIVQRFTAAAVSEGDPGRCWTTAFGKNVSLRRLRPPPPHDKRTRGFIDDILTSDSINTLLLMDYGVLLARRSVRCLRMKCYPL